MSALLKPGVDGNALKNQFRDLINEVGGVDAAAGFCRVGKSALSRYQSKSAADANWFAPVDVVRDLEDLVGVPIVTRYLAREAGHGLVVMQRLETATTADVHAAIARCARGHGEAMSAALTAVADGRITGAEARELIPEIEASIAAKQLLCALVRAAAEDDA